MILDDFQKNIVMSVLSYYLEHPDLYSTDCTVIDDDGFFTFDVFVPDDAKSLYQHLKDGNSDIDDMYVDDILELVRAYKDEANANMHFDTLSDKKSFHKNLNALIRFLKEYALQNHIPLIEQEEPCELPDIPLPPLK